MKIVAALGLVALLAAGCGGSRAALRPTFRSSPGWRVGSMSGRTCPGVPDVSCAFAAGWASTVAYRDCGNCVPPYRTLAALPPDGILVQVQDVRPSRRTRPRSWPPRVRLSDVRAGFEGVPRRFGMFGGVARRDGVDSYFYVWFGRAQPTPAQLARANGELARISP